MKKTLIQREYYEPCYMFITLQACFLAFLIAGLTQSRLYAEILYWISAFIAAYGNIYFKEIKRLGEDAVKKEESP